MVIQVLPHDGPSDSLIDPVLQQCSPDSSLGNLIESLLDISFQNEERQIPGSAFLPDLVYSLKQFSYLIMLSKTKHVFRLFF